MYMYILLPDSPELLFPCDPSPVLQELLFSDRMFRLPGIFEQSIVIGELIFYNNEKTKYDDMIMY